MHILDIFCKIFFPTNLLSGMILSLVFTTLTLCFLWKIYKKKYSFTRKEKTVTFLLSFLFMVAGTVIPFNLFPIIVWGLLAFQFMVDRKYMDLPDGVNLAIAVLAIYPIAVNGMEEGFLQSGMVTGILLFLIFLVLALLGPMGGGDIKLMGAIGLYFNLWDIPNLLLYGFLIGTIQGVGLMIVHKQGKDTLFAFGPALILGVLTTVWLKGDV